MNLFQCPICSEDFETSDKQFAHFYYQHLDHSNKPHIPSEFRSCFCCATTFSTPGNFKIHLNIKYGIYGKSGGLFAIYHKVMLGVEP